jgi:hypothetical protein
MQVNVLFINGWGGAITSQSLARLRNDTVVRFRRRIYAPPPVNHQETGLILRYLEKWTDTQILVGLSCGCSTINAIAHHAKQGERIPFAMYCSPSIYCGLGYVPAIVERATQVTSWGLDFFNPGSRLLVQRAAGNNVTVIDKLQTSSGHGFTPSAAGVRELLWSEIERAMRPKARVKK